MKIFFSVLSLLLAVIVFYLKNIQWSIDTILMELYNIDVVKEQMKMQIMTLSHQLFNIAIIIAIISLAIAIVSIKNKLCNKISGVVLLLISVLSVLCSLIRV
jgi:hypothetical protein